MRKKNYLKSIYLFITFLLLTGYGYGQTTLTAGDVAITGFNTDNPDQISFVLLTDITASTVIKFTDNGWFAAGGFRTNEGILTWTADSDLSYGTEILITNNTSMFSASVGTAIETDTGFALTTDGEQILVYQGTEASPTFIYAINSDSTGWSDATSATTSALPPSLTDGVNAVSLGETDSGNYNCNNASGISISLSDISNSANWNTSNSSQTLGSCSYCTSTVTWDGTSWSSIPDARTEVVINGDYNTGSGGTQTSFTSCTLTINPTYTLTVANGTYVEVNNGVICDGNIYVETQGNFVQNNYSGTFTLNGTATVHKVTASKNNWQYYTYWSSPVTGQTIAGAFPNTDGDRRFSFNASNYIDSDGDDIDDNGDDWVIAAGTDIMTPGVGYIAASGRLGLYPGADSADFIGAFNTGDITTSLSHNAINITGSWNLIGNPYPSAIDFDAFYAANSSTVNGVAYYWSHASPPLASNPGNEDENFSQNDYATYTVGSGGAAGASGVIPNEYVPSGQSFFIDCTSSGNVTFTNAMRMADGTSNALFFRNSKSKKAQALDNKLWINLNSDNGVFNQILVAYVDGATNDNDGVYYDAPKLLSNESAILYSKIENSTKPFVIQGKDVASINEDEIINIGFKTSINTPTLYTLSIAQLQGDFLTNNSIYLKDNLLNVTHNLSVSNYTFTSETGEFNNRFEIVFKEDSTLSINKDTFNNNSVKIIELENDNVQFKSSNNLNIKNVNVFDFLGRNLYNFKGNNAVETYNLSNINGIYIAKIELSNGAVISKKAIKK